MSEVTRAEFDALKQENAALKEALEALSKRLDEMQGIPEEHLHAIAAAVACFLGKRATIKYVRKAVLPGGSWRDQGRVTVAASHNLPSTKGW